MKQVNPTPSRILRWPFLGFALILVIIALQSGCKLEPDRDNPYDPNSPAYHDHGTVELTVTDGSGNPLNDAEVRALEHDFARYTNSNGTVVFDLEPGQVTFQIRHELYAPKLFSTSIQSFRDLSETVLLNGTPLIDSIQAQTHIEHLDSGRDLFAYDYKFNVYCNDIDGVEDLTHLFTYDPDGIRIDSSGVGAVTSIYQETGNDVTSLNDLLFRDFRFILYDESNDSTIATKQFVKILHYPGLTTSMSQSGPNFIIGEMKFKWENVANDDPFVPDTYRLRIFQNDLTNMTLVDSLIVFPNPQDSVHFTVIVYQTEGFQDNVSNYWQLTLYDNYGSTVTSDRRLFTPQDIDQTPGP